MCKSILVAIALVLSLEACTIGDIADARATLKGASAAAKSYVSTKIETRKEFRSGILAVDRAKYDALMGAARDAERAGNLEKAFEYWAAAREHYVERMPHLEDIKKRFGDFFRDD